MSFHGEEHAKGTSGKQRWSLMLMTAQAQRRKLSMPLIKAWRVEPRARRIFNEFRTSVALPGTFSI
jgi:uncharacterized phage-associated protein